MGPGAAASVYGGDREGLADRVVFRRDFMEVQKQARLMAAGKCPSYAERTNAKAPRQQCAWRV